MRVAAHTPSVCRPLACLIPFWLALGLIHFPCNSKGSIKHRLFITDGDFGLEGFWVCKVVIQLPPSRLVSRSYTRSLISQLEPCIHWWGRGHSWKHTHTLLTVNTLQAPMRVNTQHCSDGAFSTTVKLPKHSTSLYLKQVRCPGAYTACVELTRQSEHFSACQKKVTHFIW